MKVFIIGITTLNKFLLNYSLFIPIHAILHHGKQQ